MYSIFHTSHCGSTLLACLLSKSVPTVTEPKWSHEIRMTDSLETKVALHSSNHTDGLLVKYSSLVCEIAPHVKGKKVFLYRNFQDHIEKLNPVDTQAEAMLWCFRFSNLAKANDVMYIESHYFLNNQQEVAKAVCEWFGVTYTPVEIDYHVKQAGLNHRDTPIQL